MAGKKAAPKKAVKKKTTVTQDATASFLEKAIAGANVALELKHKALEQEYLDLLSLCKKQKEELDNLREDYNALIVSNNKEAARNMRLIQKVKKSMGLIEAASQSLNAGITMEV